jgi:hypothetical protein
VARDIGDPTPEIAEQVGEDGFGQREGLLAPKILLDHTKAKAGFTPFTDHTHHAGLSPPATEIIERRVERLRNRGGSY